VGLGINGKGGPCGTDINLKSVSAAAAEKGRLERALSDFSLAYIHMHFPAPPF
jgi:hypothetical protein